MLLLSLKNKTFFSCSTSVRWAREAGRRWNWKIRVREEWKVLRGLLKRKPDTHIVYERYIRDEQHWRVDRSEFSMKWKRVQLCCLRCCSTSIFLAARETFRFHFFLITSLALYFALSITAAGPPDRTSSQVFYAKMRNSIFHNFSHLPAWDSFWHACGGGLKNEKKKRKNKRVNNFYEEKQRKKNDEKWKKKL